MTRMPTLWVFIGERCIGAFEAWIKEPRCNPHAVSYRPLADLTSLEVHPAKGVTLESSYDLALRFR